MKKSNAGGQAERAHLISSDSAGQNGKRTELNYGSQRQSVSLPCMGQGTVPCPAFTSTAPVFPEKRLRAGKPSMQIGKNRMPVNRFIPCLKTKNTQDRPRCHTPTASNNIRAPRSVRIAARKFAVAVISARSTLRGRAFSDSAWQAGRGLSARYRGRGQGCCKP